MEITNAVVFITGASSGIGAATARAASRAGARVVLVARSEDKLRALAQELDDAVVAACDITRPEQVAAAIQTALDAYGRIDVLINNAGQGLQGRIEDIESVNFRAILELNLIAPQTTMKEVAPLMREQGGGAIVNIGSGITFSALPETGGYSASKAGLAKLSAIARAELADDGIVVSTLFPFVTETNFIASISAGRESAEALEADHAPEPHPPEKVAAAVLDLIRSGAAQADLVPEEFGGSYRG